MPPSPEASPKMPVLFVGHGSPMNAIEDNVYSRKWRALGQELPKPRAILCISAHWLTRGTGVTAMLHPKTIHDFGGFPKALFDARYPAPGSPSIAQEVQSIVTGAQVSLDQEWGLDHGTWSVLLPMFPKADIPVLQLSIDYPKPGQFHYDLGRELAVLRQRGILIVASGNMVHNLRLAAFDHIDDPGFGFDWAKEMDQKFTSLIASGDHAQLIAWEKLGPAAKLAIPTPDHYYPLLYALGAQQPGDTVQLFNEGTVGGAFTMTSLRLG